ncbi:MAG: hypothetical protein WC741_02785 [Patescibacteria group bacterium]|jgi:hypothetical protein
MSLIEVQKKGVEKAQGWSARNKILPKITTAVALSLSAAACSPAIEQVVNPNQYLMPDLSKPDLGFDENQKKEYERIQQSFSLADSQNKILFKNDDGKTFSKSNSLDILAKSTGVNPEQITNVTPDTFFYFKIGNLIFADHKFSKDGKSFMMVFGSADQTNWAQTLILDPVQINPDGTTNIKSGSRFVDPEQQPIGGFLIPTETQGEWTILFNPETVGSNPTPVPAVPTAVIAQNENTVSNISLPANFDLFPLSVPVEPSNPTPVNPTPVNPPTPSETSTPLTPSVNPEYSSLQTLFDGQKVPYTIVEGQIEVGGHKIIANDLGLIIFADQTGIQTWNQEKNSWQAIDLADETTFTGEMKVNVDKWAEDIKNGGNYGSTLPEHQAKFDKQYQFLMKTFLLNQTDFLNQNAEVIKSWGYNSLGEMDAQHISWLFDKYNIENHKASMLLPSEVLNSFKENKPPISYQGLDEKYYQGFASDYSLKEKDKNFELFLNTDLYNRSAINLEIGGVQVPTTNPIERRIWGSLIAVKIIPGISKEKMIAEKLLFGPSPIHPSFSSTIRIVNFEDIPSLIAFNGPNRYDLDDMPGASFPSVFAARDIFDISKKWSFLDFINNLGNQIDSGGKSQNITLANGETKPVGVYFPLGPQMMIPGNMTVGFYPPDFAEAQVWPWNPSQ